MTNQFATSPRLRNPILLVGAFAGHKDAHAGSSYHLALGCWQVPSKLLEKMNLRPGRISSLQDLGISAPTRFQQRVISSIAAGQELSKFQWVSFQALVKDIRDVPSSTTRLKDSSTFVNSFQVLSLLCGVLDLPGKNRLSRRRIIGVQHSGGGKTIAAVIAACSDSMFVRASGALWVKSGLSTVITRQCVTIPRAHSRLIEGQPCRSSCQVLILVATDEMALKTTEALSWLYFAFLVPTCPRATNGLQRLPFCLPNR